MKIHLERFRRIADTVQPSLKSRQLEASVGLWHDSGVLKFQKRHWRELTSDESLEAGIFFSIWVEAKSLKKNQAFYNIHALRLRSMSPYTLQSREFAAAFRARFQHQKDDWPNVSLEYGPQTLMQGWIALDSGHADEEMTALIRLFIPAATIIDELLDARKAVASKGRPKTGVNRNA